MSELKFKKAGKIIRVVLSLILCMGILAGSYNIRAAKAEDKVTIDNIYVSEKNYEKDMKEQVEPYLKSIQKEGTIKGKENVNLYYRTYIVDKPKGSIVIVQGFGEFVERYNDVIYYFTKSGYNVFTMENRGNARSESLGTMDNTQVNVESFQYYMDDLKQFLDKIVVPENKSSHLFVMGQSMGGAITTGFLEEYPNYFDAAVLSAPMFEINTGSIPGFLVKMAASFYKITGKDDSYATGQGPYTAPKSVNDVATSSKSRFEYHNKIVESNDKLKRGGASYRWVYESLNELKKITKKKNVEKIQIPVIMFEAEKDTSVGKSGQDKFEKYSKTCQVVQVKGSKHEIYRECDSIQKGYVEDILSFYNKNN